MLNVSGYGAKIDVLPLPYESIEWRNELSCDHFPPIQAFKEVTTNLGLCHSMGLHQDWKSWDFGCNSRHFHFRSLSKDWPKPLFWKSHSAHLPGYTAVRDCELITKQTASRLAIGPSNVLSAWAETLVLHVICSLPFGLCLIKLRPSSGAFPSCCWSHPASHCSLTGVTHPLAGASLRVGHWNLSFLPVHPQLSLARHLGSCKLGKQRVHSVVSVSSLSSPNAVLGLLDFPWPSYTSISLVQSYTLL